MNNKEPEGKSWWKSPERQWRLYSEDFSPQGYILAISLPPPMGRVLGPQATPFLKPGVDRILEELEGAVPDVDKISVALMKLEPNIENQIRKCLSSGKANQARLLLADYDPRFQVATERMWETLFEIFRPKIGPPKSELRLFADRYIKEHEGELSKKNRREAVMDIYFAAKKVKLGSENAENDRRVIREAYDDFSPDSKPT